MGTFGWNISSRSCLACNITWACLIVLLLHENTPNYIKFHILTFMLPASCNFSRIQFYGTSFFAIIFIFSVKSETSTLFPCKQVKCSDISWCVWSFHIEIVKLLGIVLRGNYFLVAQLRGKEVALDSKTNCTMQINSLKKECKQTHTKVSKLMACPSL